MSLTQQAPRCMHCVILIVTMINIIYSESFNRLVNFMPDENVFVPYNDIIYI